jgi:hypothetical protein
VTGDVGQMNKCEHRFHLDCIRQLLRRLVFAFTHGLAFVVDESNAVTSAPIPHKTSLTGGEEDGFPGQRFLWKCNHQLDNICVPIFSLY